MLPQAARRLKVGRLRQSKESASVVPACDSFAPYFPRRYAAWKHLCLQCSQRTTTPKHQATLLMAVTNSSGRTVGPLATALPRAVRASCLKRLQLVSLQSEGSTMSHKRLPEYEIRCKKDHPNLNSHVVWVVDTLHPLQHQDKPYSAVREAQDRNSHRS